MNPSITLVGISLQGDDESYLTLPLSETHSTYSGKEPLEIVYQDLRYMYQIDGLDPSFLDAEIEVIINNKELGIVEWAEDEREGSVSFTLRLEDDCPFFLVYGITDIALRFTLTDGSERYLFSGHLAVAVNQKSGEDLSVSISEMLSDIYTQNHHILYSEKPRTKQKSPYYLYSEKNKYDEETKLLEEVIQTLYRLLPNFTNSPRTTLKTEFKVDSFEKLHTVSSQNLNYIVTHPEYLKPSFGTVGIPVGKRRMFPEKTLVTSNYFSCDTVENRGVLSFIYTLLQSCEQKRQGFIKTLDTAFLNFSVNGVLKENYVLSTAVIREQTKIAFEDYLEQYKLIVRQLSDIFSQYQRVIPCSYSHLTHPPSPTPVYLEIYHYRKVFELMLSWFGNSEHHLPSKAPLLHFSSADAIYEYYCLLNICDILVELGFEEQTDRRTHYLYSVNHENFSNTEVDNTYYFQKEGCKVTLYYQPIVYSGYSDTTNEIGLFRTDSSYYSPDFIIKREDKSGVTYSILDSKWRKQSTLLDKRNEGGLVDTVYKYVYSILDIHTFQPVSFFWLLQGKDEEGRTKQIYFHRKGDVSHSLKDTIGWEEYEKFKYATGIVQFTPKSGTERLSKVLQVILS